MAVECLEWMNEMVRREVRIRKEISEKVGEDVYTPNQILKMLNYLDRRFERYHLNTLRSTAKNNNLTVNVDDLEMSAGERQGKYYVRASKIEELMNLLGIHFSKSDLEHAAFNLGYSQNIKT